MDLNTSASEFFDESFWIAIGITLLISTVAFIVMYLYLRSIFKESQRSTSSFQSKPIGENDTQQLEISTIGFLNISTEIPVGSIVHQPFISPTFQHADKAFNYAARIYTLGGSIFAAISVSLLFLFGIYTTPYTTSSLTLIGCYLAIFWAWSFFTVISLAFIYGPETRFRKLLFFGYFMALPAMGFLLQILDAPPLPFVNVGMIPKEEAVLLLSFVSAAIKQPVSAESVTFSALTQPVLFWGLSMAPVMIPIFGFNRFIRGTVGPLFINMALVMVVSVFILMDIVLYANSGIRAVSQIKDIFGDHTLKVLMGICLIISAILAWIGLRWVVRRYRRKQLSDHTFLLDALWLSLTLWVAVYLMNNNVHFIYLLSFFPFIMYKIVTGYGLYQIKRRAAKLQKSRMLYLRVFGSSSRSEKLFDLLASHWRYVGSINLISATDIARNRFEPDEFLNFIQGKLSEGYISNENDLDRRVGSIELKTDPDGRYRVNEFFCHADTWQQTVIMLMKQSDLVVMDLRAFTFERKGCIFEISALIDTVPLDLVILLIDKTTDVPFLRQTLLNLWQRINPESPNAFKINPSIKIINLACGYSVAVRRLMQLGDEKMASQTVIN